MRPALVASLLLLSAAALAAPPPPPLKLTPADTAAAFRAAGFTRAGGQWKACGDPGTTSYSPGAIEQVADLNGDGRPEAIVTEGGTYCFGMTGQGYTLVSKQANGTWKRMTGGTGMVSVLATRGAGGWPDLEIGGPGFCFPVERWNGRAYALHRHQYQGKPCRPNG